MPPQSEPAVEVRGGEKIMVNGQLTMMKNS